MASREGGGGGAIGWTLLGFLAGVAATLAAQILLSSGGPRMVHEAATPAQIAITPQPPVDAAVAPEHIAPPAVSSRPVQASAAAQSQDQVADDAAAAGMTSRTTTSSSDSSSGQ